jgi:hypothetical protein
MAKNHLDIDNVATEPVHDSTTMNVNDFLRSPGTRII